MPTQHYTVRIPDDLKTLADRKAEALGLNFSGAVNAALREWAGSGDGAMLAGSAAAVRSLESQLARARDELARARADLARITGAPVAPGNPRAGAVESERALAAGLAAATEAAPVTRRILVALSGYSQQYAQVLLTQLVRAGYVTRAGWGLYVPVPGADIMQGVLEARKAVSAASMARAAAAAAAGASVPSPAPGKPATAVTEPEKGKSAARENGGSAPRAASRPPVAAKKEKAAAAVQAARDAGHDVTTASELAVQPGTAVFRSFAPEDAPFIPEPAPVPEIPASRAKTGLDGCRHPLNRRIGDICGACGKPVKKAAKK